MESDLLPMITPADMTEHIQLMESGIRGSARTFFAVPSFDYPGKWMLAMESEEGLRLFLSKSNSCAQRFKSSNDLLSYAREVGIKRVVFESLDKVNSEDAA